MAGIYIHIPFCRRKCHYCDFYKSLDTGFTDKFLNALNKEIKLQQPYLGSEIVNTIYLGGGTPSTLDARQIREILEQIHKSYNVSDNAEITFEVNPDDTSRLYFKDLFRDGINRLSVGIQSWQDKTLKELNRRHNSQQAEDCITDAIVAGFNNISVDLIYGIPGMGLDEWNESLDRTFSLDIQHLSAYHLTIEDNTHFGNMKEKGELTEEGEQESEAQFAMLIEKSEKHGFIQYEISNLCKEGFYSQHNTNYWRQVNYLGLGPSAHSYNGFSRQWNTSNLNQYIKSLDKGEVANEKENLDEKMKYNEYVMTSLRTMWGADLEFIEQSFNKEARDYLFNIATRLIKYGMVELKEKRNLVLTNQGKMISDNIISELLMG